MGRLPHTGQQWWSTLGAANSDCLTRKASTKFTRLIALMLSGCAKRLGDAQAPGATVELAGQVQLSWERPTTKADGTPLTDISGYKIYYGLTSQTYDFTKTVSNQNHVRYIRPGTRAHVLLYGDGL